MVGGGRCGRGMSLTDEAVVRGCADGAVASCRSARLLRRPRAHPLLRARECVRACMRAATLTRACCGARVRAAVRACPCCGVCVCTLRCKRARAAAFACARYGACARVDEAGVCAVGAGKSRRGPGADPDPGYPSLLHAPCGCCARQCAQRMGRRGGLSAFTTGGELRAVPVGWVGGGGMPAGDDSDGLMGLGGGRYATASSTCTSACFEQCLPSTPHAPGLLHRPATSGL